MTPYLGRQTRRRCWEHRATARHVPLRRTARHFTGFEAVINALADYSCTDLQYLSSLYNRP
jgi:hypothetical protein